MDNNVLDISKNKKSSRMRERFSLSVYGDLEEMLELNTLNKKLTEKSLSSKTITNFASTSSVSEISEDTTPTFSSPTTAKTLATNTILYNSENVNPCNNDVSNKTVVEYDSPVITFSTLSLNNSGTTSFDSSSSSTSTESLNHVVLFKNQIQ